MVLLTEELVLQKTRSEDLATVRNLNLWGSDLSDVAILQVAAVRWGREEGRRVPTQAIARATSSPSAPSIQRTRALTPLAPSRSRLSLSPLPVCAEDAQCRGPVAVRQQDKVSETEGTLATS